MAGKEKGRKWKRTTERTKKMQCDQQLRAGKIILTNHQIENGKRKASTETALTGYRLGREREREWILVGGKRRSKDHSNDTEEEGGTKKRNKAVFSWESADCSNCRRDDELRFVELSLLHSFTAHCVVQALLPE